MDIVERLRFYVIGDSDINAAADEIEGLRKQLEETSTKHERLVFLTMGDLSLRDIEIKGLREEVERLRKANKRLGEIASDAVGWLPPASVNGPREEYQNEIKELTDGHC
jgi:predicted RNase H-like nuclease (RuvC/YqgF family)